MKKHLLVFGFSLLLYISYAQTIVNTPLQRINKPVEAEEFVIFHTDNSGTSSSPTKTTLGHYDRSLGLNANQRIVQDNSSTHPTSWNTVGSHAMNVLTLDIDGDSYDEVIEAHESTQGITIGTPFMTKSPLATDSLHGNFITTGLTVGVDQPRFKMAKGDFRHNGKYYFAIAYRNYTTNKINIEVRSVDPVTHYGTQLALVAVDSFYSIGTSKQEIFDITINDFDGDGVPDIALADLEKDAGGMTCYLHTFKVTPGTDTYNGWTITPMSSQIVSAAGNSSGLENLAISSGVYDSTLAPQNQIAVGMVYVDRNDNTLLHRKLFVASTASGSAGLNTITVAASNFVSDQSNYNDFPAISIASGDLNSNANDEIVLAFDNSIQIFSVGDGMIITPKASASGGGVVSQFYELANNNSYISIGDADLDLQNDILMVTSSDDGNSLQWLTLTIFGTNNNLSSFTNKGNNYHLQQANSSGFGSDYRFAAAFGEFSGGRGILKAPIHFTRKVLTPLIVNNGPPYHFDIVDNDTADITACFPNFTCNMNSQYQAVTTTTSTVETTLNSDWGTSGTLSAGGSVLGIGLKASITASYGEAFSNVQNSTSTVQISTLSTALADDQIYGVVSDYDMYEYPVDSSGVTIGYVLAMMRSANPIIQWMDSKSADAYSYVPDHEVGNILSYASTTDFPNYTGDIATIKPGTGFNVGSGGTLNFSMSFTDFASNSVSQTNTFGVEVNASASYYGLELDAKGTYNSSELTTHSSTAESEVSYISNLQAPLNPLYSDANYTITPNVYWAKNGAITLGYAVDPSLPSGGTTNFWKDHYTTKPDLTVIMPWKYDPEKGYTLGNTPDKRRLCKSMVFNKTEFITGDTVIITTYIQNYSFKTYSGSAQFQFYVGDPDNGGVLLSDINGQTMLTVNDSFPARGRKAVQFYWKVPAGVGPGSRIYIVIDPNNLIDEVHEDNNVGFNILGDGGISGIEQENNVVAFNTRLFPNPTADGWTQVQIELPANGKLNVELYDLQGRLIESLYNSNLNSGHYLLPVSASELPKGYYLVKVNFNGQQQMLRLVNM